MPSDRTTPSARTELKRSLGAPLVPPPAATRLLTRFRSVLGRAGRRSAPPPVQILESVLSLYDNRALGLIVDLGVPERLDRPMTATELATACDADADAMERLLRFATSRGFVCRGRDGRFAPNATTEALRPGTGSWRAWVEFLSSDWFWNACRELDRSFARSEPVPGIVAATGHDFFDYVNRVNIEAGAAFNGAMEAGATLQTLALIDGLDWTGVDSICDVGGGSGAATEVILRYLPSVRATLFELPEVVAASRSTLSEGPLADRCELVGGNFFESVPAGLDRYLLLAIIHDWSDAEAVEILRNLHTALGPDSTAVVVEAVLPGDGHDDFANASDLLMLTLATGRERTRGEHMTLFRAADLDLRATHRLPTGFVAYELGA